MMAGLLFIVVLLALLCGFPVALTLGGSAFLFALLGLWTGHFDWIFLQALPERLFGVMTNDALLSIPLFVFMGVILEKSRMSEDLLLSMSKLFGRFRGGLGISVVIVGAILAASTGVVGATVVTMGLISLPAMLRQGYAPHLATGVICASGTLGQIIPPSVILIILGDIIGSAHQQAQLLQGNFAPTAISIGDFFKAAIVPGLILVGLYMLYIIGLSFFKPHSVPPAAKEETGKDTWKEFLISLIPALLLIVGVLGSLLMGWATATESASVGAVGAVLLTILRKRFTWRDLTAASFETTKINAMVFSILFGASLFSLVFKGFHGDEMVQGFLTNLHESPQVTLLIVMAVIFGLGFFLDFFEICFVVVPIVGPALLMMGFDPVWLGILIAMNLQTSFLTPPFGFSLFYLRGVAPKEVTTQMIYRGVIPFIILQLIGLALVWNFPELLIQSSNP
jgi:tripartite ATP-independent transporter DctM subunit